MRPAPVAPHPSSPAHSDTHRPHWRDTFASLRVRNYRLYVISQVLTNTCGWMQRVAQDWLILSLTGNVAWVGLTVTLQLAPMLLFGLWGGVVADRFDKRRLLMITQSLFALSALVLGLLTLLGAIEPWHVLASAAFLGLAIVVDNPTRQAFVPEVAGHEHLRNAISINSTVFQLGALVGPALAAVGIALVGEGWSFVVNAMAGVVAVVLLVAMRPSELSAAPAIARARGQLRAGLHYVGEKPVILWSTVLVGFVAITGINLATVLAAYADDVFGIGAAGYGLLNSCLAAGAVAGALASTRRKSLRLRTLVYSAAVLGVLQMTAGVINSLPLFCIVLVGVGAVSLLYLTGGNTLVQTTVAGTMRGRVMALYILVLFGAQAGSGTLIGWIAHEFGAHVAMVVSGAGPLLGAVVVGAVLARKGRLTTRLILRDRPGRGLLYVVPRDSVPQAAVSLTPGLLSRGLRGRSRSTHPAERRRRRQPRAVPGRAAHPRQHTERTWTRTGRMR
ncbi:MFS transporter [Jiangella alkaliphila]|uniref:Predicted arabinose efflux permease, MFS family n=1 Tax=Jiangella alkaliphila TaxID=419479 RepID=A0A1H2G2L3_9ACTN|nr:MFS transporter [Jiangella alkaliphila]SDU13866.1 Predicted arabinose efflux permease, MFS family [Jiangella alkaliphila]